jgi:hypothetical protein
MTQCPCCGAVERLGVWLTPRLAEVFDKVKRTGTEGLHWSDSGMSRELLKAHVWRLNDVLEETDFAIKASRGSDAKYQLTRRNT